LVRYEIASAANAADPYLAERTVIELAIISNPVDPKFKPTRIPPNPEKSSAEHR
jgi:hypothetical protein